MTRLSPRIQPCNAVFGFVLLGGSINGAVIHDIRLANELHRRGYPVRVWWVVDRPDISPLSDGIPERWLFHSFRYATGAVSSFLDCFGKLACGVVSERRRSALAQRVPWFVAGTLRGLIKFVCAGVESDPRLIRGFARELTQAKVTHVLETIEILAPIVAAARTQVTHPLKCLVQFQGYETYAPYAARLGLEQQMYQRIREAVDSSDWPAVTVSGPYSNRIHHEIGIPLSSMRSVSPGIPIAPPIDADHARGLVQRQFSDYDPMVPLVSYLGRQDSEKGIDLLLYAARILHQRGIPFQLAICGPTAFGSRYSIACRQIAQTLRLPVLRSDFLSNELRTALFRASHCVVYPSIHAEPFGMVPVEAMVQGTPVIVPDTGGVSELPFLHGLQGGLNFRTWDSGDLARQLEQLLTNTSLHGRLASAAPLIAAHYSVERFADRMLDHLGLPHWPDSDRTLDVPVTEPLTRRAA
jgi:glycosyltransferase involved in cell wall biosynthesis